MKNVFVKPNEQCQACSDIVKARIGNRRHGALSEVERQNALFEKRNRTFSLSQMNNAELARTLSWRELEIANTELGAKWKGKTHFSRNEKRTHRFRQKKKRPCASFGSVSHSLRPPFAAHGLAKQTSYRIAVCLFSTIRLMVIN